MVATRIEATLVDANNLLVASPDLRLGFDFFGAVVADLPANLSGRSLYLTGDVSRFRGIFRDHAPLNHVLAQIYANTSATVGHKQTKAKISAHADKTKDMPVNGIMAFCTFYDGLGKLRALPDDPFDYGHKGKTGLTRLHFRLKEPVLEREGLLPAFSVTLYPGSVFFMPLSTNRLYTHEIQSSMLDAAMLPTRLGYVVRCSKTEAVHQRGTTYLEIDGQRVPMEAPTPDGMAALRELYAVENRSDTVVDYGDRFRFSMNEGDYKAPDLK